VTCAQPSPSPLTLERAIRSVDVPSTANLPSLPHNVKINPLRRRHPHRCLRSHRCRILRHCRRSQHQTRRCRCGNGCRDANARPNPSAHGGPVDDDAGGCCRFVKTRRNRELENRWWRNDRVDSAESCWIDRFSSSRRSKRWPARCLSPARREGTIRQWSLS
jgi:hypothetical protein